MPVRPVCLAGGGDEHCCWLGGGGVCPHLRDDGPDAPARRWVCTLREELGDWDRVHSDPRYVRDVRVWWDDPESSIVKARGEGGTDCGNYPAAADERCGVCGAVGVTLGRG